MVDENIPKMTVRALSARGDDLLEIRIHFFPKAYRLETTQEVLVKGKEITRR